MQVDFNNQNYLKEIVKNHSLKELELTSNRNESKRNDDINWQFSRLENFKTTVVDNPCPMAEETYDKQAISQLQK